jgi:hypothetical protein
MINRNNHLVETSHNPIVASVPTMLTGYAPHSLSHCIYWFCGSLRPHFTSFSCTLQSRNTKWFQDISWKHYGIYTLESMECTYPFAWNFSLSPLLSSYRNTFMWYIRVQMSPQGSYVFPYKLFIFSMWVRGKTRNRGLFCGNAWGIWLRRVVVLGYDLGFHSSFFPRDGLNSSHFHCGIHCWRHPATLSVL